MNNRTFYNEVLTDHNRYPGHKEKLADANLVLEGVNPSCGDDIVLQLRVEDGRIAEGTFTATAAPSHRLPWISCWIWSSERPRKRPCTWRICFFG